MKRRAFTLLELLLVIGIMGLMGTAAIGSYRQMRVGMEERSVMQNVNQFIRAAYQRAQIDRQPVTVYFWNETLREETSSEPPVVVGKAVAIRREGRVTYAQGQYLGDEFGDLRYNRLVLDAEDESESSSSSASSGSGQGSGVYLYRINGDEGAQKKRSMVSATTVRLSPENEPLLLGGIASVEQYAYEVINAGGVTWKIGDAYGFEFADIQLPHNYMFGSNWSRSRTSPVSGETTMRFRVSANSGSGANTGTDGASTIDVCALRPGGSGTAEAKKIGVTESPTQKLSN